MQLYIMIILPSSCSLVLCHFYKAVLDSTSFLLSIKGSDKFLQKIYSFFSSSSVISHSFLCIYLCYSCFNRRMSQIFCHVWHRHPHVYATVLNIFNSKADATSCSVKYLVFTDTVFVHYSIIFIQFHNWWGISKIDYYNLELHKRTFFTL